MLCLTLKGDDFTVDINVFLEKQTHKKARWADSTNQNNFFMCIKCLQPSFFHNLSIS